MTGCLGDCAVVTVACLLLSGLSVPVRAAVGQACPHRTAGGICRHYAGTVMQAVVLDGLDAFLHWSEFAWKT